MVSTGQLYIEDPSLCDTLAYQLQSVSNITDVESIRCVNSHALHSDELCSKVLENTEAYTPSPTDGGDNDGGKNDDAPGATTNPPVPTETPPSSSSAAGATIGGVVAGVLLLVAIILIFVYCRNIQKENGAIPRLTDGTRETAATAHNQMYNADSTVATPAEDFGSGNYATAPIKKHSTLYSIPMDASDGGSGDGGSSAATDADGNPVKKSTVMYVSALNLDSPEYATAVASDALYSVVSNPGGGDTDARLGGHGALQVVYATIADDEGRGASANGVNYDVAVHPQNGSASGSRAAEYSHLSARGNSSNYDVAVHPQNGRTASASASTAEYSHMAPRSTAGGGAVLADQNNHYDVGTPRAIKPRAAKGQNNHYDVGTPRAIGTTRGDAEYSSVA